MKRQSLYYVTSNKYKIEEVDILVKECLLSDGRRVCDHFDLRIRNVAVKEILEVDIEKMVLAEAKRAYSEIRVPCVVEHAGLIFLEYLKEGYPGGLTKPMWDTLGKNFVQETNSAGKKAIARAFVGYCDGLRVKAYSGETHGTIANTPRGSRNFYWDTVFIPEIEGGNESGRTFAEIVDSPELGLVHKVKKLSQSSRAMLKLLNQIMLDDSSGLWRLRQ